MVRVLLGVDEVETRSVGVPAQQNELKGFVYGQCVVTLPPKTRPS